MSRGDGGFGDRDFGGGDYDGPDLGDVDSGAGEELPEGEGPVRTPDEAAEDAVLRHVLDAVRGGETPDVVPPTSSVAGFAECLAVEAVLDKRWPETRIGPRWSGSRTSSSCSATHTAATPWCTWTGTNGKTSTARMVDALLQRDRSAHRPLHQPAPAERHGADQHRQPAGHPRSATSRSTATSRRSWTSSTPATTRR